MYNIHSVQMYTDVYECLHMYTTYIYDCLVLFPEVGSSLAVGSAIQKRNGGFSKRRCHAMRLKPNQTAGVTDMNSLGIGIKKEIKRKEGRRAQSRRKEGTRHLFKLLLDMVL